MPVILAESGGDGGGSNNNDDDDGWFRRELGDRSVTEHSLYGLVLCREIIYLIVFWVLGGFWCGGDGHSQKHIPGL